MNSEILNNPFYYEPHPLCVEAAHSVIADILRHPEWWPEVQGGKTFGVLIVEEGQKKNPLLTNNTEETNSDSSPCTLHSSLLPPSKRGLGWVSSFSGQMLGSYDWEGYVPAVFDYLDENGYFKQHEAEIVAINKQIENLTKSTELSRARDILYKVEQEKPVAPPSSKESDFASREAWIRQRQFEKAEHHRAKQRWKARVEEAQHDLQTIQDHITALKEERRQRSDALQRWLFEHFEMLNARGEKKNLIDIFTEWSARTGSKCVMPPSGSGECCAPKLLQYAYAHGLKPIAIAEFTVSLHKQGVPQEKIFLPPSEGGLGRVCESGGGVSWRQACDSRCKPILDWMLQGINVAANPLEQQEERTTVDIIYEDDEMIAINKPAGMLSVPGKSSRKSAIDILRSMRPDIPELIMAHRLDMQTSGVLIAAKSLRKYKELQQMFLDHTLVKKTYRAVLEGILPLPVGTKGRISLPLSPDFINRPRQIIDHENGKTAITDYEVLPPKDGHTVLLLSPLTGRTHQLRMHCASPEGLNMPILGDDLYGHHADRMYLHAQSITIDGKTIEANDF